MIDHTPLKLLAKDLMDLQIIAAHLQDALAPLMGMHLNQQDKTFCLLANRFCWEHKPYEHEGEPLYHRVHSGLNFHNVQQVKRQGFHLKGEVRTLNLLTIQGEEQDDHMQLTLIFSGGYHIWLRQDDLHCHMGDLHEPWATRKHPRHIYEYVDGPLEYE